MSHECPKDKCFLSLIYPNSDANLACDTKCFFCKGSDGEKYLENYIKENPEKWEILNSKNKI